MTKTCLIYHVLTHKKRLSWANFFNIIENVLYLRIEPCTADRQTMLACSHSRKDFCLSKRRKKRCIGYTTCITHITHYRLVYTVKHTWKYSVLAAKTSWKLIFQRLTRCFQFYHLFTFWRFTFMPPKGFCDSKYIKPSW